MSNYIEDDDLDEDEIRATKELRKRGYGKKGMLKRLINIIHDEYREIEKNGINTDDKFQKMNVMLNMMKIIENYDELEPTLKKFFSDKHDREKFNNDNDKDDYDKFRI